MLKTYIITYRMVLRERFMKIEAYSKYNAKVKFKKLYPHYEFIKAEEVVNED